MTVIAEQNNLGDLLKYEEGHRYSRQVVTVAAGERLELGAVVGRISATGRIKRWDPAATDGSQTPVGVLLGAVDASLIERDDALLLARHAIVSEAALIWPAAVSAADQASARAALEALGILLGTSA